MQPAVVIRLRPLGPWRLGAGENAGTRVESIFRSDRLFSALTLAMQQLDYLADWLDATALSPTPVLTLSSLFPYQGDSLFVPPPGPLWPPPPALLTSSSPVFVSKTRWNAAQFVPVSLVESLLLGQPLVAEQWMLDGESGSLLRRDRPSASPFRSSYRSSAAVDRLTASSVLVHGSACVEFEPASGLWCVVRFADEASRSSWGDRIKSAFRLLADTGFGGRRTSGWGQSAAPEFQEGTWPGVLMPKLARRRQGTGNGDSDENALQFWLLSLYSPGPNDSVDWNEGDYRLTVRDGWVQSPSKPGRQKKSVRMVTEGSVLQMSKEPVGTAVDVAPEGFEHSVYRSGFALALQLPVPEVGTVETGPVETTPVEDLADLGDGCAAPTPSDQFEVPAEETPAELPSEPSPDGEGEEQPEPPQSAENIEAENPQTEDVPDGEIPAETPVESQDGSSPETKTGGESAKSEMNLPELPKTEAGPVGEPPAQGPDNEI